jgi:hypothetical protein
MLGTVTRVEDKSRTRAETGFMARSFDYDDRPEAQHVPLRMDEVEALILNGGQVLREPRRVLHFLNRVVTTLRDQGARVSQLQQDVETIRRERSQSAHPMARAVQAIAELTEEQKQQLLDHGYLLELEKLKKAQEDAELVRLGAENEINRVRMALAGLLEDPSIPSEAKQYVRMTLGRIGYQY